MYEFMLHCHETFYSEIHRKKNVSSIIYFKVFMIFVEFLLHTAVRIGLM